MPMIDPARAAYMADLANKLDHTVDELDHAIERQEALAEQVGNVRRRSHWLIAGLAASLLIALGAVVAALTAFNNAEDVRAITRRQDTAEQVTVFATCLVRNAPTLETDLRFARMFDTLATIVSNQAVVDELRAAAGVIPTDQRFSDCDNDGVAGDPGDFPSELAPYAPIPE